jgi:hypothetical protein
VNDIKKATHTGELKMGIINIPCAVLEDGTRVITQRGIYRAIGRSYSTGGLTPKGGAQPIPRFLSPLNLKPFISDDLRCALEPLRIKGKGIGRGAYGFKAEILPEICNVYLDARSAGILTPNQLKFAARCEILMRGFAKVGIIALVDEATGYQEIRDRIALQKILDKYLLAEYAKWAKRFPDEFYQLMFKFKGWQWRGMSINRPSVVGKYTNDLVYERLAPGLLNELRRLNPPDEYGRRKVRHQQWFTEDIGHPALQKHLAILIAFMKAAPNWNVFHRMVERALPKLGETIPMALDED